jgi:hypothetical protein
MKTIWRLALAMICVALMLRSTNAADGRLQASRHQVPDPDRIHPRSRASLTAPTRPKPLPNSRKRAAGAGFLPHKPVNNASLLRSRVSRPALSSPGTVRHRGPNPAVVAGTLNVASRSTGAIDGTRMRRRP